MAGREAKHFKALPWFASCLNHFEVTNIGANHDLMELFEEPVPEIDAMK